MSTDLRTDSVERPRRASLPPTGPGAYATRRGLLAHLSHQDGRGRWHGAVPGYYVKTLWHANGAHNLAHSDDLVACFAAEGERD